MNAPKLVPPTIAGKGLKLVVEGLPFEVDGSAIVRVSPVGHILVAVAGDLLGHVLIRHGYGVKEVGLDPATATRLAKLLRGEIKPEKKIPAAVASAPQQQATPASRRAMRWVDCQLTGPVFVTLGSRVFRVPEGSEIKFNRGTGARQLAYIRVAGRVHVLSSRGEAVLQPYEATGLATNWDTLKFETI